MELQDLESEIVIDTTITQVVGILDKIDQNTREITLSYCEKNRPKVVRNCRKNSKLVREAKELITPLLGGPIIR